MNYGGRNMQMTGQNERNYHDRRGGHGGGHGLPPLPGKFQFIFFA